MNGRVRGLFVDRHAPVRDVMRVIDGGGLGIALIVEDGDRLLGTVTDGDLRRAILAGFELDLPVNRVMARRSERYRRSITANVGATNDELLHMMLEHEVRHIPLLDDRGRVVDVSFVADLVRDRGLPVRAVVMAGGEGRRLRPLTREVPKPMLPIGGRPLLETTLERLRRAGIHRCTLTTHYLGDVIRGHFGDGRGVDMQLSYVEEASPLGTAGALRMLEPGDETLLLMNGDVLTGIDVAAFCAFHHEQRAAVTLGVRPYEVAVPFGVVATDGPRVTAIEEKPVLRRFINAGVYLIEPEVLALVPPDGAFDMPDLVRVAIEAGHAVASYPVTEYWQDIGSADDYRKATCDFESGLLDESLSLQTAERQP